MCNSSLFKYTNLALKDQWDPCVWSPQARRAGCKRQEAQAKEEKLSEEQAAPDRHVQPKSKKYPFQHTTGFPLYDQQNG